MAKNLQVGTGAQIILLDVAIWDSIYWQVSDAAIFGTASNVNVVFPVKIFIIFNAGSSLKGAVHYHNCQLDIMSVDCALVVEVGDGRDNFNSSMGRGGRGRGTVLVPEGEDVEGRKVTVPINNC